MRFQNEGFCCWEKSVVSKLPERERYLVQISKIDSMNAFCAYISNG